MRNWFTLLLVIFASTLLAQPGTLLPSFGNGGKVVSDMGTTSHFMTAMIVQSDFTSQFAELYH